MFQKLPSCLWYWRILLSQSPLPLRSSWDGFSSLFQPGGCWRNALQLTVVFPDIKTDGDSVGADGPLPLEWSGCACVDSRPREGRAPCPLCPPPGRFSWGRWQVPQLRGGSLLSGDDGCLTTRTASLHCRWRLAGCSRGPSHPPCGSSPKFTSAQRIRNEVIIIKRINMPGEKWIINSSCALRPNNK